jgi:hypothetical protein
MVIIDTGPLVSLFDKTEPAHELCHTVLRQFRAAPVTTWPVLTEAFYLLGNWEKGQKKLWDFFLAGGARIHDIPVELHVRMRELMEKYADNPMDFADASLVVTAEIHKIKKVFTLDRGDFDHYRPKHCRHFEIIP